MLDETCRVASGLSITQHKVYAGNLDPSNIQDACHGDSGGPFVCRDPTSGLFSLEGVVSWRSPTCNFDQQNKVDSVFARVSEFRHWIIILINSRRASRRIRPSRFLSNTACSVALATSQLAHPALFLSFSTVLLQVVLGLPLALRPSGVHPNAVKQSFAPSLLKGGDPQWGP
ncbi:hypothetical protein ACROYT_G031071 [Oculina patagonica]